MTTHTRPADLFREGLRRLLDKDVTGWISLWAENGVMEFPFAPPGRPKLLEGRTAIADYMRPYPEHIDLHGFPDPTVHQTTDPATIVVETRGVGRLVETGAPFDTAYIAVVTAREGRLTAYRDYWSPLAGAEPGADFAGSIR